MATEVYEFMQKKTEWKGTFGELLKSLKSPRGRPWPITPKAVSNALARAKPNLRNVGITIQRLPREGGTGKRLIRLEKKSVAESQPSQPSQAQSDQGGVRVTVVVTLGVTMLAARRPHFRGVVTM